MASVYKNKLKERFSHDTVLVCDSLYIWAGQQNGLPKVHDNVEKKGLTSNLQVFSLASGKWSTQPTTGIPPLGVVGYSSKAIDDKVYYFGGKCNHDSCCHNSINQLDVTDLKWTELAPTDPARPVMRRAYGGMITVKLAGVYHLLIFGGMGAPPTTQLRDMQYVNLENGKWRTNEHSLFNLSTKKWSTPIITGGCIPPPTSSFILEQINDCRAILFGGLINATDITTDGMFIMDISVNSLCWQKLKNTHNQWPIERCFHAATIITPSAASPILVTIGGIGKDYVLNDCWLFDISLRTWTKVPLSDFVCKRAGLSLSSLMMGPECVWLVIIGGFNDENQLITDPCVTVFVKLEHINGQWSVEDILDSTLLSTELYQQKYLQQLQLVRRNWENECRQKPKEEEIPELKRIIQSLKEDLQQIERQQFDKDRQYRQLVQFLGEKEKQYRESQETLHIYQTLPKEQQDQWVINKEEVTITQEALGEGAYGNVKVGIFRGLRVAVKSLHNIIISDYNNALFTREMDMASRVRHPNLVQFIGATKVDNPLILTELMTTSLYKELQKKSLTRPQIISIGKDIALGLNYLHLFKPNPIIHRDVSSPNVLLEPLGGNYKAKLTDYGAANLQQLARSVMPGNPTYAAPEANSPSDHSPSMDVYSYAVLLMEMNLHCPPAMSVEERGEQVLSITWPAMKSFILRGLVIDRTARPSMAQLAETIESIE